VCSVQGFKSLKAKIAVSTSKLVLLILQFVSLRRLASSLPSSWMICLLGAKKGKDLAFKAMCDWISTLIQLSKATNAKCVSCGGALTESIFCPRCGKKRSDQMYNLNMRGFEYRRNVGGHTDAVANKIAEIGSEIRGFLDAQKKKTKNLEDAQNGFEQASEDSKKALSATNPALPKDIAVLRKRFAIDESAAEVLCYLFYKTAESSGDANIVTKAEFMTFLSKASEAFEMKMDDAQMKRLWTDAAGSGGMHAMKGKDGLTLQRFVSFVYTTFPSISLMNVWELRRFMTKHFQVQ